MDEDVDMEEHPTMMPSEAIKQENMDDYNTYQASSIDMISDVKEEQESSDIKHFDIAHIKDTLHRDTSACDCKYTQSESGLESINMIKVEPEGSPVEDVKEETSSLDSVKLHATRVEQLVSDSPLLPEGLCFKTRGSDDNQQSIWTTTQFNRGRAFGPFENMTVRLPGLNMPLEDMYRCFMSVTNDNERVEPSAKDLWIHHLQWATWRDSNIVAYGIGNDLYLKMESDVPANTELFVRYKQIHGDRLTCSECGKTFKQARLLQEHKLLHTGEKPHTCLQCDKSFRYLRSLQVHAKTHGLPDKSHKCPKCDKCYPVSWSLKRHMLTHKEDGARCHACGAEFSEAALLQEHTATCSQMVDKRHQCSECDKSYARAQSLRVHMMTHAGELPHVCQECGKGFTLPGILRNHQQVHSVEKPHKCQECGKCFRQSSSLHKHLIMHKDIRKHTCEDCGKSFREASHLRNHELIHREEKNHKCPKCGRCFRLPGQLRRHNNEFHEGMKRRR